MNRSEQINELAAALAKAQAKIRVAPKDNVADVRSKTGASYKYRYSTLADVWEACRQALADNGLALVQTVGTEGPSVTVTTMLAHSSGQWVSGDTTLVGADAAPQTIGSCITYGRRYGLSAMVGVVSDEDDDGAAATHGKQNGKGSGAPATKLSTEDRDRIQKDTHDELKAKFEKAATSDDLEKAAGEARQAGEDGRLSEEQRLSLSGPYLTRKAALKAPAQAKA